MNVHLKYNYFISAVLPQHSDFTAPDVYFHFVTDQCWINYNAQFVSNVLLLVNIS